MGALVAKSGRIGALRSAKPASWRMTAWVEILAIIVLCFGAEPARAATGGTTVAVDGANATITVRIDLCCLADAYEQMMYGQLVQLKVKAAQDRWNDALRNLSAKGCYELRVMFDMRLLNKEDPWDPGFHKINIDFTRPERSYSKDPLRRIDNADR